MGIVKNAKSPKSQKLKGALIIVVVPSSQEINSITYKQYKFKEAPQKPRIFNAIMLLELTLDIIACA